MIEVEDNGPGIPAERREVIFDPYVTTKHTGTGLGLAIVKKIAIEHGGMITAEPSSLAPSLHGQRGSPKSVAGFASGSAATAIASAPSQFGPGAGSWVTGVIVPSTADSR